MVFPQGLTLKKNKHIRRSQCYKVAKILPHPIVFLELHEEGKVEMWFAYIFELQSIYGYRPGALSAIERRQSQPQCYSLALLSPIAY